MYSEEQLVGIARRENNTKRSYLVVNRLQGKHVPVSPKKALEMFSELAGLVKNAYDGEKLLLVGFAETATAIGAALAVELDTLYMQTTREKISGVEYLYFSESHSHATEQKLVKDDVERVIDAIDRIVFVEDEVTTGNTILKIIKILEEKYPGRTAFAVASLLNGMDEDALHTYRKRNIPVHYLVKTNHGRYGEIAGRYRGDGIYRSVGAEGAGGLEQRQMSTEPEQSRMPGEPDCKKVRKISVTGWMNARRCVEADKYRTACEKLWKTIEKTVGIVDKQRVLVLGTEEFMYPALYIAGKLEAQYKESFVRFHATTRSPIIVSSEKEYPLHTRYELKSFYDRERKTFIYNLEKYDRVLIITDAAEDSREGSDTLADALRSCGNEEILLVRWCGE